jgi:hypothetical protein
VLAVAPVAPTATRAAADARTTRRKRTSRLLPYRGLPASIRRRCRPQRLQQPIRVDVDKPVTAIFNDPSLTELGHWIPLFDGPLHRVPEAYFWERAGD